jgi:hypothetical protein
MWAGEKHTEKKMPQMCENIESMRERLAFQDYGNQHIAEACMHTRPSEHYTSVPQALNLNISDCHGAVHRGVPRGSPNRPVPDKQRGTYGPKRFPTKDHTSATLSDHVHGAIQAGDHRNIERQGLWNQTALRRSNALNIRHVRGEQGRGA